MKKKKRLHIAVSSLLPTRPRAASVMESEASIKNLRILVYYCILNKIKIFSVKYALDDKKCEYKARRAI